MSGFPLAADAFGDRFELAELPLPRPPAGYAVQMLDTDCLLDRVSGKFLPVRSLELKALFGSFVEAHAAAEDWVAQFSTPDEHQLAIVPAGYDPTLGRHVLIYGVLRGQP